MTKLSEIEQMPSKDKEKSEKMMIVTFKNLDYKHLASTKFIAIGDRSTKRAALCSKIKNKLKFDDASNPDQILWQNFCEKRLGNALNMMFVRFVSVFAVTMVARLLLFLFNLKHFYNDDKRFHSDSRVWYWVLTLALPIVSKIFASLTLKFVHALMKFSSEDKKSFVSYEYYNMIQLTFYLTYINTLV